MNLIFKIMVFFQNFLVAIFIVGLLTRTAYFFLIKKVEKKIAVVLSFLIVGIFLFPIVSIFISFDIALSKYLISFLIWIIIDMMRVSFK
jgi:hypothetical protein